MSREQVVNFSDGDGSYQIGNLLSTPSPSEQVVISGIAGSFPMSENVEVFKKNLFDKVDMITKSRWADTVDDPDVPKDSGLVQHIEKFDSGYFGIHHQYAHFMDPSMRIVLERTMECIFDAGIHPTDLKNSRTGVFAGICKLETKCGIWEEEFFENKSHVLTGYVKTI
ncbi:hypothetical protein NQ318_002017 [Aromia moschata]|uniref:Beta-ketoacyl synthase-like N-terminal domain-containing protein n=1 Tax=Aromia moschata TaxID=1265417 RepID=A0AAV8Z2B9_9CUCU|nr:hypothetical protein NQ318_002017 [Aromia moschata]